jgi:hypothetical protein
MFSESENSMALSENSMALSERLYLETGSQKFKMAAPNRMYLYLSFYTRYQRNSNGYMHVFGIEQVVALSGRLHLETGSEKFNWRH